MIKKIKVEIVSFKWLGIMLIVFIFVFLGLGIVLEYIGVNKYLLSKKIKLYYWFFFKCDS